MSHGFSDVLRTIEKKDKPQINSGTSFFLVQTLKIFLYTVYIFIGLFLVDQKNFSIYCIHFHWVVFSGPNIIES